MREEGIDNKQLIVAIQELEKEKGIKKRLFIRFYRISIINSI